MSKITNDGLTGVMSVGASDVKIGCLETGNVVSVRQRSPDTSLPAA